MSPALGSPLPPKETSPAEIIRRSRKPLWIADKIRRRNPHAKFAKSAKCRRSKIRIIADCFYVFFVFFVVKILRRLTQPRSSRSERLPRSKIFGCFRSFCCGLTSAIHKEGWLRLKGKGGALFHWQAGTPAVDGNVDTPKRKALDPIQLLPPHSSLLTQNPSVLSRIPQKFFSPSLAF